MSLLQQIAALPEEIQRAAEEYRPLLIANYVYELAKRFNDFYHACPVLTSEEPTRSARLRLVDGDAADAGERPGAAGDRRAGGDVGKENLTPYPCFSAEERGVWRRGA